MQIRRALLHSTLTLALVGIPAGAAVGDTSGSAHGPTFVRNVSQTPALASSKAKIDGFGFYVPSRNASGDPVDVVYRDASGRFVEARNEARPLLSVYTDDAVDPAAGDDVWAAYSLDDGDTWQRTNLSMAADRSSFLIGSVAYPGLVSKPALTLKGNKALVAWTSTYCASGFPAYEQMETPDLHGVKLPQESVDYAVQGYPEVGEVPYKCVWAVRGLVDKGTGAITWYQPERLTSGARYAMQLAVNSAPNAGFVIAWAEDPQGLNPGSARGPGEGWTGANPHPGTDVWYSYLTMRGFDAAVSDPVADPDDPAQISARPRPAEKFSVPVPVSDNAQQPGGSPAVVGATRPAVNLSPYSYAAEGRTVYGAWVAYGYEETKAGSTGEVESGKQVLHHAFAFAAPDVDARGDLVSDPAQSGRRVRYITQPMGQMGASRTVGLILYRMGPDGQAGAADFITRRFVVPDSDTVVDNPFRLGNLTEPTNVSATTALTSAQDPTTGAPRVVTWEQTAPNLDDGTADSSLESARGHRGMIKGDFLALGYLWTANWDLYLQGLDIENYYVRRSFDGGQSYTAAPASAPYYGDGVTSCRYFNDPVSGALLAPECRSVGPGEFEPAQNLTRLDGFDETAIEPRLFGLPGSIPASEGSGTAPGVPYPEDTQDVSVVWQAWGTGSPQEAEGGDDGADVSASDADIPVPGDSGKGPRDIYYTFSRDYGDTYVRNDTMAAGASAQAEVQLRFAPDGSKVYAAWNDLGTPDGVGGQLDVFFRRLMPEAFPNNRAPAPPPSDGDTTPPPGDDTTPPPSDPTDVSAPVSTATSPRYSTSTGVRVRYTSADEASGSGLAKVDLWARAPGAASFSKVMTDTATRADGVFEYAAARQGAFAFYTVATDRAGNVENPPGAADCVTKVDTTPPVIRRRMGQGPYTFDIGEQVRLALRFRVTEQVRLTVVVRQEGEPIRRLAPSAVSRGLVTKYWNGRDADRHLVESGRYVVVVKAEDLAGNKAAMRTPMRVDR
ncbi:MAG TPA: choice-of-anchor O protein [Nocardioidaceae bacterium]|nr:choice-of-anchor O protein [Nocardioidaceae bacterium]